MKKFIFIAALLLAASPAFASRDYLGPSDYYTVVFDHETQTCMANASLFDGKDRTVAWDGVVMDFEGVVFVFAHKDWAGLRDRLVNVAIRFSNGYTFAGQAELEEGALAVSPATRYERDQLIEAWSESSKLTIHTTKGVSYPWPLDGTMRALVGLQACWRDHFGERTNDPFGDTSIQSDPF